MQSISQHCILYPACEFGWHEISKWKGFFGL